MKRIGYAIWRGMTEIYGTRWAETRGPVPSEYWLAAIEEYDIDPETAKTAIIKLTRHAREFPPSLGQFVEMCRGSSGVRFLGAPETSADRRRRLARPVSPVDVVEHHLANMRAVVGRALQRPVRRDVGDLKRNPSLAEGCLCQSKGTCRVCIAWQKHGSGEVAE